MLSNGTGERTYVSMVARRECQQKPHAFYLASNAEKRDIWSTHNCTRVGANSIAFQWCIVYSPNFVVFALDRLEDGSFSFKSWAPIVVPTLSPGTVYEPSGGKSNAHLNNVNIIEKKNYLFVPVYLSNSWSAMHLQDEMRIWQYASITRQPLADVNPSYAG